MRLVQGLTAGTVLQLGGQSRCLDVRRAGCTLIRGRWHNGVYSPNAALLQGSILYIIYVCVLSCDWLTLKPKGAELGSIWHVRHVNRGSALAYPGLQRRTDIPPMIYQEPWLAWSLKATRGALATRRYVIFGC